MKTIKNFILTLVTVFVTTISFGQETFDITNDYLNSFFFEEVQDGQTTFNGETVFNVFSTFNFAIVHMSDEFNITDVNDDIIESQYYDYNSGEFICNLIFKNNLSNNFIFNAYGDYLLFIDNGEVAFKDWLQVEIQIIDGFLSITENKTTVTSLNAYPNPVVDYLNIEFETTETDVVVNIFNSTGQLIYTDNEVRHFGANNIVVPMLDNPKGIYVVRIGSDTRKIVRL